MTTGVADLVLPLARTKKPGAGQEPLNLRVDPDWKAAAKAAAESAGLSLSDYIRIAVNRLMNDPEFKRSMAMPKRKARRPPSDGA